MTVIDFLHSVKARTDELAILGAPMEEEDLIEKILDGLGDDYKELVRAVQARDTSITFDELHEKLLSFEASLSANTKSEIHLSITANPTNRTTPTNTNWRPHKTNTNWRPNHSSSMGNTTGIHLQPTMAVLLWPPTQVFQLATIALHPVHTRDFAKSVAFKVTPSNAVNPFNLYQSNHPLQVLHQQLTLPHLGSQRLTMLPILPPIIHHGC